MVIQPPGFQLPDDLEYPRPVPGLGSTMDPVEITGGFVADFYGISYKVWSSQANVTKFEIQVKIKVIYSSVYHTR